MITEELQKGKKYTLMVEIGVNIIHYANSHDSLKSFLMVEAKIITWSDVVSNVHRGNT